MRKTLILALAAASVAGPALAQAPASSCEGFINIVSLDQRLMAKSGPNAGAIEYTVLLSNPRPAEMRYTIRLEGFDGLSGRPSGMEVRTIAAGATNSERLGIARGSSLNLQELRRGIRLSCLRARTAPTG